MTPKEKAEELVDKFTTIDFEENAKRYWEEREAPWIDLEIARQCALIAVNEIIEAIPIHNPIAVEPLLYFWQEVKRQIEKL